MMSIAALAARHDGADFTSENATVHEESEISQAYDYYGSYIRFNCAFNMPAGSVIGAQRSNSFAGQSRTTYNGRRNSQRTDGKDMVFKYGRSSVPASLRSFHAAINLFPSGKLSENHHFISLHKLVI